MYFFISILKVKKDFIKMRKSATKTKEQKKQVPLKINKRKEELTVNVIQYNRTMEQFKKDTQDMLVNCSKLASSFTNQRELMARSKMVERVLVSALNMINNNKLQLWMIDDNAIEDESKQ